MHWFFLKEDEYLSTISFKNLWKRKFPSVSRFRFTLIVPNCKELLKIWLFHQREVSLKWRSQFFLFIHGIVTLNAKVVKRFCHCVVVSIFFIVDSPTPKALLTIWKHESLKFHHNSSFRRSNGKIFRKLILLSLRENE